MKFISATSSAARHGLVAAMLLVPAHALAGDVSVSSARCAPAVRVVARDAALSTVLAKLAAALDFQVHFDAAYDPLITADAMQRAEDLPARLAPFENVAILLGRDPRCRGQQRIVAIWVLRAGSAGVFARRESPQPAECITGNDEHTVRTAGMHFID